MAGIEILRQDETLILDDMRRAARPLYAARFSDYERRHRDPPATLDDETVILDGIPPRRRGYAMNRANPDDLHQLFAARFSEQQRRRLDAITNDLNLRRSGHQINDGGVRRRLRNGDEEQQRLSSEIWRYLSTENYEKDECGGFCVVCQSEFEEGDKLGKLRCGHSYHATCIHTWLLKKNTCPLCKQTAISELCNQ